MVVQGYIQTPLGSLEVTKTNLGIKSVKLLKEMVKKELPEELWDVAVQFEEYFNRKRKKFELDLDWTEAPEFYKQIWEQLLQIPYGRTTSYAALAEKVGNPKAVRAVGLANRNNPIPIIVPCHRVLAKSGDLHGYFYGLEVKRQLLELENPEQFARQGELF